MDVDFIFYHYSNVFDSLSRKDTPPERAAFGGQETVSESAGTLAMSRAAAAVRIISGIMYMPL